MALVLDGSNDTITGLQINSANIVDGSIVNADINDLAASKLTGALPAISGAALTNLDAGKILQVKQTTKIDTFTTSSQSYTDVTGLSVSITPASSSNKILIILDIKVTEITNPVIPPNKKIIKKEKSKLLIALITFSYVPITTSIREPLIPGIIINAIARIPEIKTTRIFVFSMKFSGIR